MRFKVIGRDQIFTHHPNVMWPSNTQPYSVCHLPLVLGATDATWRATGLKWICGHSKVNRTKGTRVDYRTKYSAHQYSYSGARIRGHLVDITSV